MSDAQMFACCDHCYRGTGHVPPHGDAVHIIPCNTCGQYYNTKEQTK